MEETSGLTRHNGDDSTEVHVNIGGDCPDAGTEIPDRFTAADGCTKNKNGVEETCADRPHEDDTVSGTYSQDQCVTAKRCKRSKDGVQEVNEDRPDGDDSHAGADSPDRCLAAKRRKTSKSSVKEASTSGPHHGNLNDETKNGSDYSIAPDTLSNIDKYRYRPLDSRDKLVVSTKEHCFLNSRNAGGQVSLDLENLLGEKEKLCVKCGGSGQLLICSKCPVVVHQSCLGYEASFENMGNFCCPHCSYRCLDAEYKSAKKKLESAINALSIFYGINVAERVPGCQRQVDPPIASREEEAIGHAIHISPIKGKDVPSNIFDKSQCKSGEEHMQAQCGIAHESNVARTIGELTHHVSHQESMESQQQKEASIANRGDDLLGRDNSTVYHETCEVSLSKRRSYNQNVFQEQTSIREAEDEMVTKATNGLETNSSPSRDAASITQRLVEERNQEKTVLPQVVKPSQASVIELNTSGEKNTGDENKGGVGLEKPIKPQGATIRSNPTSPNLRRRKRLWTAEEEEMLKEGVQKFSGVVAKNLPWRKILEHGRHVFDESRAPAELKDKWRKMLAKEGAEEGPK
ncbi:uncharacterized protein LOC122094044 [Macadamia integrifolia]|uniref:uncharacterized protein LOC122094044 n=1 Tax=Macadamia integrifolia TaxID=60698 RepID=UPI001C52C5B3|nr:uncharacterized protein LOC122094044 [Macadamia integrifolia]